MIVGGADFDFRVDVEGVLQDPEYQAMALADKKQLIVKAIDKNQLYYAYSDMDDRDVQEMMSESDIAFNKSFYGKRDLYWPKRKHEILSSQLFMRLMTIRVIF